MTLTEFLLQRFAEDEADARNASGNTVTGSARNWTPVPTGDEWGWAEDRGSGTVEILVGLRPGMPQPPDPMSGYWGVVVDWEPNEDEASAYARAFAPHIARWDPARVLAECESKRQIVDLYRDESGFLVRWGFIGFRGSETLRLLALPYADHPDYNEEWRP